MMLKKPASEAPHVLAKLVVLGSILIVTASFSTSAQAPPRDDRQFLQALIDDCPTRSNCELPPGSFAISGPLEVHKSVRIKGAGGGPGRKAGKPTTQIQVAAGVRAPAFSIEGMGGNIQVSIRDLNVVGAGILVGGLKEPCRGIDDPLDRFRVDLALKDVSIAAPALDGIKFEGGSLALQDVEVVANGQGNGLYIANATGDIVIQDAEFEGNERWGILVCNLEGTGQIFMNDVSANTNGQGGIAIVGQGTAPSFRTVCMQNTGAAFNFRFGVLLFDVSKTLLFNVTAGFTFEEPGEPVSHFGDGIAVFASHELFFWNVLASLNERAGFSAFGPNPSEMTHVHLVGDFSALNNGLDLAEEGDAEFHLHDDGQTIISGLCGFASPITAPPLDAHCEHDLVEEGCMIESPGIEPPSPPTP